MTCQQCEQRAAEAALEQEVADLEAVVKKYRKSDTYASAEYCLLVRQTIEAQTRLMRLQRENYESNR